MFEQKEFKGLAKTVIQAEYLILCLTLLYIVLPGGFTYEKTYVLLGATVYTLFLLLYHFFLNKHPSVLRLAIKSIGSTLFITGVVWFTGKVDSPLLSLYIIVVISTAMVIGSSTTLLLVGLISAFELFINYSTYSFAFFTLEHIDKIIELVSNIFTMLLVGYLTRMLASHMQNAKDEIRAFSERDELTGLLNRRTFISIMEKDHKLFSQYSNQFSILMIDIDNISTVNNEFGYLIGNRVVVLVANTIKRAINQTDILGRYDGDEYIVLLAEASRENAKKIAEKIRAQVNATPLTLEGGKEIFVTCSIGVASYPGDSGDLNELLKRADFAMYESKDHGKNQTTLYADLFRENAA